jgi:hypothetical protein
MAMSENQTAWAKRPEMSVFVEVINESMRLTGCSSKKPGLCCDYHEGMWDGMHALAAREGSDAT